MTCESLNARLFFYVNLWKTCKNSLQISVDNVVFVVYNRGINNKRKDNMDEKTRKELEEAHKKAMEGIKAFNSAMKDNIDTMKDYIGTAK